MYPKVDERKRLLKRLYLGISFGAVLDQFSTNKCLRNPMQQNNANKMRFLMNSHVQIMLNSMRESR